MSGLKAIHQAILDDPANRQATAAGILPLYSASRQSRIAIIGQAPGKKAQDSGIPWHDPSGVKLRQWLGLTDEQFYDAQLVALLPMDFYFPGKGPHGDLPPRADFASTWHPRILANLPALQVTILIGRYAQAAYLGKRQKANLTETVKAFRDYLPEYFPIVHPSPLNFRWQAKNPWFATEVLPALQDVVGPVVSGGA
jgi:uracil-DNA glycosylase